jgi:tetratricopeptide (TPR) repeat protein
LKTLQSSSVSTDLDADISWLLIFDNADGEDAKTVLNDFWPNNTNGSILITSRNRTFYTEHGGVHLDELEPEDAQSLLLKMSKPAASPHVSATTELDAARRLLDKIGRIHQAARLILNSGDTLCSFEEVYDLRAIIEDDQHTKFIQNAVDYPYNLTTVWSLSFARLSDQQMTMINIMAFLDPDLIPHDILINLSEILVDAGSTPRARKRALIQARRSLLDNSLIDSNETLGEWRMHRVVQAYCHHRMQKEERQKAFDAAFEIINCAWQVTPTDRRHDKSLWPAQQMCVKHVQSLSRYFEESKELGKPLVLGADRFTRLLQHAAWYGSAGSATNTVADSRARYMYERGMIEQAYPLLTAAEAILLASTDPEADLILAAVYNVRASLETESNMFEEALKDFDSQQQCINRSIQHGTLKHGDLREVFAVSGYANGLCGINDYETAEKTWKRARQLYTDGGFPKPLHEISMAQTNLATCLWLQGKLSDAEDLLAKVIIDRSDASSYRYVSVLCQEIIR